MRRFLAASLILCAVVPAALDAAEVRGTVVRVVPSERRLQVDVGGTKKTYDVVPGASIVRQDPGGKQSATIRVIEDGLAGIAVGSVVEFLAEELDGRTAITSLKVTTLGSNASSTPAAKKPAAKKPAAKKSATKGGTKKKVGGKSQGPRRVAASGKTK